MRRIARFLRQAGKDYLDFGWGGVRALIGWHRWEAGNVRVELAGVGPMVIRPVDSDMETIRQVFAQRQYEVAGAQAERLAQRYRDLVAAGSRPLIVDAGANIGASAIWFAQAFPQALVVAVEPDPANARLCRENTARLGNVRVVEAAIGGTSGRAEVKAGDKSWAVQTVRAGDPGPGEGLDIVTIADIVAEAGPEARLFQVKIDIEGFEADLFAGDTAWVGEAAAIFIEPHDWMLPGQGSSQAMQRALLGAGFEILINGENLIFVRAEVAEAERAGRASAGALGASFAP